MANPALYLDNYRPPQPQHIPEGQGPPHPPNAPPRPFESMHGNTRLLQFPDGSAAIGNSQSPEQNQRLNADDHHQNLAKVLPDNVVRQVGYELKMAVEEDIQSQEVYFQAIADIIKLLGLNLNTVDKKEDLPFEGATGICSTALFESLLDMLATATSSLFPPTGMVDEVIQGESTPELRDKAYRKKLFFNNYLTNVAKEFKKEARRALEWAILTGSCYKKVYIDPVLQRPTSMFIRPEDFIVNAQYSTHLSATRKTHIIRMSGKDIKIRMLMGRYRDDVQLIKSDGYRDDEIQEALDETTGIDRNTYQVNLDEEYVLYEIHADYYIKDDPLAPKFDLPMPYIVTVDSKSGYVLDICRNWERNDFLRKKKEYFVNYSLFPSLEGEGYGLVHYAGNLAEAATAIKRQLINTGTYANFPGGIYAAGIRLENNNLRPNPGEFVPVQTGGVPIDQVITTLPYKEPSPTLGKLLTDIEDSIKKPSAIINQKVAEMTPHAPVGSVLAMLESLQKVPNAILEGFHESFGQELMLFNERFGEWLPPNVPYPFKVPGGEFQIMKNDFDEDVKIVPASNPALQNSSYRFLQSEIILNQARQSADIHDMRFAYKYFYENLGLSPEDVKQLIPPPAAPPPPPFSGDPITENTYLMTNKPVQAKIMQDHSAHMVVHQLVLANPNSAPEVIAATKAHLQEHESLQFLVEMQQALHFELPPDPAQIPPEMQNQIAVAAAQVAQDKLAAMKPAQAAPPPIDQGAAAIEIEHIRSQQKREAEANKTELEKMKLALAEAKFKTEIALEEMRMQQKDHSDVMKNESDRETITLKLEQERDIAMMKQELEYKKLESDQLEQERNELLKRVQAMEHTAAQVPHIEDEANI